MTATNHVVMGALVATVFHNPLIAIPVAVLSHFALDSLPHFDYLEKNQKSLKSLIGLSTDMAIAASILVAIYILHPASVWLVLACAVAAASPDLMWLYYLVSKKKHPKEARPSIVRFHSNIQGHTGPKLWPVELVWLGLIGSIVAGRLI